MPRKTDANNPADWLWMAAADLEVVKLASRSRVSFTTCRSKLAEVLERMIKGELIRLGWPLERTHDLDRLLDELVARRSDLVPRIEPLCDTLAEVYFTNRYPGFDLDDPDWSVLDQQIAEVQQLLDLLQVRAGS